MPDITIPEAARVEAVRAVNRRIDIHGETRLGYLVYEALAAAAPHIAAQTLRDMGEWFDRAAQLGTGERDVIAAQACYDRANQIEADHG